MTSRVPTQKKGANGVYVCLCVNQLVSQSVCQPACLPACPVVCMCACMRACFCVFFFFEVGGQQGFFPQPEGTPPPGEGA